MSTSPPTNAASPPSTLPAAQRAIAFAVGALVFAFLSATILYVESRSDALERELASEIASRYARQIEQHLSHNLAVTHALAAWIRQQNGQVRGFSHLARELRLGYPGVSALQLAPKGIIREIEPLAGNEAALGLNLLADAAADQEAHPSLQSGQLTFAEPFTLVQDGETLSGRLPVFLSEAGEERFWGFVIALIRLADFLPLAHLEELYAKGYDYVLWRIHPVDQHRQILAGTPAILSQKPIEIIVQVPNGEWRLSLLPRTGWTHAAHWQIGLLLATLLAFICGHLAYRYLLRLHQAQQALLAAKEYAESLIRTANVMVVELNFDGTVRNFNPAAERITGYAIEEVRGQNWFERLVPKDRFPEVWEEFERIRSQHDIIDEFENPVVCKSGETRIIAWRNSPLIEHGRIIGTLSFGLDITERRATEAALRENLAWLEEAQKAARLGYWSLDPYNLRLYGSSGFHRLLGLAPDSPPLSIEEFIGRLAEHDRPKARALFKRLQTSGEAQESVFKLNRPDGETTYLRYRANALRTASGAIERIIGTIQDVTLETLQEMAIRESEERFRTIANYTYDWEYWLGNAGEILFMSPSCTRITGYTPTDFIRDPALLLQIIHPEDRPLFERHLAQANELDVCELAFRIVTKEGETRWIAHGCRPVITAHGERRGRRASNRDITELKAAEQRAYELAHFDPLTGLPNRRLLTDRLSHALAHARRHRRPLAVLFIDLDEFKPINDRLGHAAGDRVLVETSKRLLACVREGDTLARIGGDEFVLVLPELGKPEDAGKVADKILAALTPPFAVQGEAISLTLSIGIALFTGEAEHDAESLIALADQAMYAAKSAGRNTWRMVAPE